MTDLLIGGGKPPHSTIPVEEAKRLADEIDKGFIASARILANVRANLLRLHDTCGYVALGYRSWQEFVDLRLVPSVSTITRELEAARIEQAMGIDTSTSIETYPKSWLKAVADVPDELKLLTLQVSEAVSKGSNNSTWITATAEVIQEMVATGGMVSVEGVQTLFDSAAAETLPTSFEASIVETATERIKRQRQYIFDKLNKSDRSIVDWLTAKVRITKTGPETYEVFVLSPLDIKRIDYLLTWQGTLDQMLTVKKIKELEIPGEQNTI